MRYLFLALILIVAISGCVEVPTGNILKLKIADSPGIQQMLKQSDTSQSATSNTANSCGNGECDYTRVLKNSESVVINISDISYSITLVGVVSDNTVVIKVNDDIEGIDKQEVKTIGGIDIYVDDIKCCKAGDKQARIYLMENPITCSQDC